jgi:phage recombination protein Bet
MSNEKKELSVSFDVEGSNVTLTPNIMQNYLVNGGGSITMPEFKFFTELCKVRKLNPFLKQAYCIKYGNEPATLVVGKDVLVERAVRHPQYDGKESGIIVLNASGEQVEKNGCFYGPDETVIGGWCRVYRKDRSHPEYMSVSVEEVASKKKDGTYNINWKSKTATMVEKVAKVRALRESFIDEFQGMYEAEEFGEQPINSQPIEEVKLNKENVIEVEAEEVQEVNINEV